MSEIITIKEKKGIQSVSARDLHEKLEIKSHFNDWFNRICEYGFLENEDYKAVTQKKVTAQGNSSEYIDYYISVDMAKQICMLLKTEKGMEYRRYFLEVEKKWKEKQSSKYKEARIKSIEVRKGFTGTLQNHGYIKSYEYINTTKAMKKPFGITSKKTDMTESELKKITAAEYLAEAMLSDEQGYKEVNPVCIEASIEIERILGKRKIIA